MDIPIEIKERLENNPHALRVRVYQGRGINGYTELWQSIAWKEGYLACYYDMNGGQQDETADQL